MPEYFDMVVIGAGPAGEKGAAQAAYFGKRVAIVERSRARVAGANAWVPSKTFARPRCTSPGSDSATSTRV